MKALTNIKPFTLHNELKKKFKPMFPKERLYHYTTVDPFLKLMDKEGRFYCTYFRALNDDKEFWEGVDYVFEYLKKWGKITEGRCQKLRAEVSKAEAMKGNLPWIMSFSLERDSLQQWMSYTDKKSGGYAIGYNFKRLESAVEALVKVKRDKAELSSDGGIPYALYFLPCFYLDRGDSKAMKNIDRFIKYMFTTFFNKVSKKDALKKRDQGALLWSQIMLISSLIKNPTFKGENEFRLVMMSCSGDIKDRVEFVGGKPRLKVPLDTVVAPLNKLVDEVVISPHGDTVALRCVAEFSMLKSGRKFDISASRSSFNGR